MGDRGMVHQAGILGSVERAVLAHIYLPLVMRQFPGGRGERLPVAPAAFAPISRCSCRHLSCMV